MGKASNKRKSARREPALVNVYSQGGITVRAQRPFPPVLVPLVVQAFRDLINDRLEDGITAVVAIQQTDFDFFGFTMASTTNPQLGDADALTWAWGASSGRALKWLTIECLSSPRPFPQFFAILPHQLELTDEGSALWLLGTEVFTMLARHLVAFQAVPDFERVWAGDATRACSILRNVVAEQLADKECVLLSEVISQDSEPVPSQKSGATRL